MTEQFTFKQSFTDGTQVNADENFIFPCRVSVDGPGNDLLAGTVLSQDQYIGIGHGDTVDRLKDFEHASRFADHILVLGIDIGVDLLLFVLKIRYLNL